jgi:cation diffusion facilitator CzcD-associated flavoprotein CzcO
MSLPQVGEGIYPLGLNLRILIIGAGFSGLGAAILLKRAGLHGITVFDRGSEVGGTWRDNTYPGCGCDVPSHLYSFSFEPRFDWHRTYAAQPQILDYLKHLVAKHGLGAHLRLGTEVRSAVWIAARQVWQLELGDGQQVEGEVLIQGVGALVRPSLPKIAGIEDFAGPTFHCARWRHDVPLNGLRVAVVGTGASAVQVVPELARIVKSLHVFQRSAPWVAPRGDVVYSPVQRWLYRCIPGLQRLNRWRVYLLGELITLGFIGHTWLHKLMCRALRQHLKRQVRDPLLRRQLTPQDTMGCKRVLVSDDWYPTLQEPHVAVVGTPIERVTAQGIVTHDGQLHAVDALIFATGFSVSGAMARTTGRAGKTLGELWQHSAPTHLGLSAHGFPNMWMLLGPNSGAGGNSVVFMIESQINYVVQAVQYLAQHGGTIDLKLSVQTASYAHVQAGMQRTVWLSGCRSWYQASAGRIDTLWPGLSLAYWRRTRRFDCKDYELKH